MDRISGTCQMIQKQCNIHVIGSPEEEKGNETKVMYLRKQCFKIFQLAE